MANFMPMPRYRGRPRGNDNFFAAMMFAQLLHQVERLPYKPPVTLFCMFALAAVYWAPEALEMIFPYARSTQDFAFNPFLIVNDQQYHRLWTSAVVHANAMHLYYNLSSFLYKGVALESVLGDGFALVIVALTFLTQTIFLGLSWFVTYQGLAPDAWVTNTVGFSGTLFALKVLLNSIEEGPAGLSFSHFFRLDLPWRKIVWFELIIAHLMVPGSSFLGHLSGILAGIIFLPFFSMMIGGGNSFMFYRTRPRFQGSGPSGFQPPPHEEAQPSWQRMPHRQFFPEPPPQRHVVPEPPPQRHFVPEPPPAVEPTPVFPEPDISVDELRRRRLARFS